MPAVEKEGDESGGGEKDDEKAQREMNAFQNLQNHFLALQSEQVGNRNFFQIALWIIQSDWYTTN